LRQKPTKGYENNKGVTLQCHCDMVATKRSDVEHDFKKDGIKAYIDSTGQWIQAKGTTLGADNGIGISLGLALLEDKNLKHGLIELAVTIEEESTFKGATELGIINGKENENFFETEALINLDSIDVTAICIGSAGGFEKKTHGNSKLNIQVFMIICKMNMQDTLLQLINYMVDIVVLILTVVLAMQLYLCHDY